MKRVYLDGNKSLFGQVAGYREALGYTQDQVAESNPEFLGSSGQTVYGLENDINKGGGSVKQLIAYMKFLGIEEITIKTSGYVQYNKDREGEQTSSEHTD